MSDLKTRIEELNVYRGGPTSQAFAKIAPILSSLAEAVDDCKDAAAEGYKGIKTDFGTVTDRLNEHDKMLADIFKYITDNHKADKPTEPSDSSGQLKPQPSDASVQLKPEKYTCHHCGKIIKGNVLVKYEHYDNLNGCQDEPIKTRMYDFSKAGGQPVPAPEPPKFEGFEVVRKDNHFGAKEFVLSGDGVTLVTGVYFPKHPSLGDDDGLTRSRYCFSDTYIYRRAEPAEKPEFNALLRPFPSGPREPDTQPDRSVDVEVAKALGKDVKFIKLSGNDNDKRGEWVIDYGRKRRDLPRYSEDVAAAIGAIEEYCKKVKERLFLSYEKYSNQPPTEPFLQWRINIGMGDGQHDKSLPLAICLAIIAHARARGQK